MIIQQEVGSRGDWREIEISRKKICCLILYNCPMHAAIGVKINASFILDRGSSEYNHKIT